MDNSSIFDGAIQWNFYKYSSENKLVEKKTHKSFVVWQSPIFLKKYIIL